MGAERRSDEDVRVRLDEIDRGYKKRAKENRTRIDHLTKWTFLLLALIAIVQIGFGGLSVYLVTQNSHRQLDIKATVARIQRQRIEFVWDGCQAQNYRNHATVSRLKGLVDRIKDPVRRARAKAEIASTVSLIDALAPHADCAQVLKMRFGFIGANLHALVNSLEHTARTP